VLDAQGKPRAIAVRVGVSDGSHTELLSAADGGVAAELQDGAQVVIGLRNASNTTSTSTRPAGPRSPF
jgi:HlyD family secretion protein